MEKKIISGRSTSILDHKIFPLILSLVMLIAAILIFYFIDFFPDYSHVKIKIFSGPASGYYYEKVEEASKLAKIRNGRIENISTNGSSENIDRLTKSGEKGVFALIQDGMPQAKGIQLAAYLTAPETVFFLGRDADRIKAMSDLRNARIGIGPKGSGTAYAAEQIFGIPKIKTLNVRLSNHTVDEQVELLRAGKLDLGIFIIRDKSAFIEKAITEYRLQIADIRQLESISQRYPFLQPGTIPQGFYDPVENLPASEKKVLKVSTLLVTGSDVKRSQIIGLLSIFNELNPNFISHNRANTNWSGIPMASPGIDYFANQGPEILDRYAPRLMDIIPMSSLVQIIMALSVFFNIMGIGNRFRLWRIDANRVTIEKEINDFLGSVMLPDEIAILKPEPSHKIRIENGSLDAIINRLEALEEKCRIWSQSMLVPMGAEMSYRYQEEIISRNITALRVYRSRLEES